MGEGVISYRVSFCDHFFYQIRIVFDKISNYEKGGFCIVFLQRVKNQRGIPVFISAVKSEVYVFLFSVAREYGVVLF